MTETELEYQFCFNCNERKQCYTKPKDCTRIKEEIGLQDMTNEEWFCKLDTEDKAREISDMTAQGYWSEELVEKWLKEKHDG